MKATLRNYRQSPRKVRLVTNLIKGRSVKEALVVLSSLPKKAADPVKKLLASATANAKSAHNVDKDTLVIQNVRVDKGIVFKRYQPRARGRAAPIRKRTSHISVVLSEQPQNQNEKRKA